MNDDLALHHVPPDDEHESPRRGLSRRGLFLAGAAGLGVTGLGAAGLSLAGAPEAAAHGTLIGRNYLKTTGCRFYYGTNSSTQYTYYFNETYYDRLGYWKDEIYGWAPDSWGWPSRVYGLGSHVDKGGMHQDARAFDMTQVWFKNSAGTDTRKYDMREDVWRNTSNSSMWRIRYWGLMASLHRRFRHVLSYLDGGHNDHIHVDNAVYSLIGDSQFYSSSTTQTLFVQAACTWVWGESTGRDGDYGPDTRRVSNAVLQRIGRSGYLHDNPSNWTSFCEHTFQRANDITG